MTPAFWNGRRVLVTGHTGFKGSWLCLWLKTLGARIAGVALAPETSPNLFTLARVEASVEDHLCDINDAKRLSDIVSSFAPEIVFHLAAQSLVRKSYAEPVETFAVNTLGVATLLNAIRACPQVRAVVVVTTDKCYENREWVWPYRENEAMGGHDPYSASKGAAELVVAAMRRSYFSDGLLHGHPARIATARAGNVIGGGDFSADRLIPDIVRGATSREGVAIVRNPSAVRPWQHALDPLHGYVLIAEHLVKSPDGRFDEGWNFGPSPDDDSAVGPLAERFVKALGKGALVLRPDPNAPHEANLLRLDSSKARARLPWKPALALHDAIDVTANWYCAWDSGADMAAFTRKQIDAFQAKLD